MITFGERVLFRPIRSYYGHSNNDYESKVLIGHYVGTRSRNADVLVMTKEGVIRGTSIQRRPETDRWLTSDYEELRGLPWRLRPSNREALEQPLPIDLPQVDRPMVDPRTTIMQGPRRLYIRRKDVEAYGVTKGCEGCESLIVGGAQKTHTEECRSRIREEMLKTEEGRARARAAEQRMEGAQGGVVLETRPDANAGEVIASEATGAPLVQISGGGQKRGQPEPQLEKRARREAAPARGTKRSAEEPPEALDGERASDRDQAPTASVGAGQGTSSSSSGLSALEKAVGEKYSQLGMSPTSMVWSGRQAVLSTEYWDHVGKGEIGSLSSVESGPVPEEPAMLEEDVADGTYYDDVTGADLKPGKVKEARQVELDWIHKQGVYTKVSLQTCYDETGKNPVTLKWVDTNKGDDVNEKYRSRLVGREIRLKGKRVLPDHQLFSSMPPLEALKLLCSMLVTLKVSKSRRKPLKLKLFDISRAHFYGEARRRVFVTLPEGDEEEGCCGLLQRSMYGTQDASSIWQSEYSSLLVEGGFKTGVASSAVFYHAGEDIRLLVHGDDFFVLADEEGQQYLEKLLSSRYDYRCEGAVGPEDGDGTELCMLNRTIRYDKETGVLEYEADQRHAELIIRTLGLENAKPVSTPGEKKKASDVLANMELPVVSRERVTLYRSLVMRSAYLSQDRGDLTDSVKCLARKMTGPTEEDFQDLKRLGRFLKGKPRVVLRFEPQRMYKECTIFTDSDHAGCLRTRRSTSGTIAMMGKHCIKAASGLQSTISLSSGESEYYGIVKAAAVGLQMKALLLDWGYDVAVSVHTDSSAAIGTCSRRGLGKLRHVQTRYLWVQERVAAEDIKIYKVGTKVNPADMCTKSLSAEMTKGFMAMTGHVYLDGRAASAKQLVS